MNVDLHQNVTQIWGNHDDVDDDDDDDDDEAKYLPSVPIESAAEDDGYFLDVSQLLQCD